MLVYIIVKTFTWSTSDTILGVFTDKQLAMDKVHKLQVNRQRDMFITYQVLEHELITDDFMKQILQSKDNT